LNRDERIDKDLARFIAELVFDKLSSNIRECVRIARLADNNIAQAQRVINLLTTYSTRVVEYRDKNKYELDIAFTLILKCYSIRLSERIYF
jgi:hypothetical protein